MHLFALSENAPEVVKPKGRAGSRKAPTKVCPVPVCHSPPLNVFTSLELMLFLLFVSSFYQQERSTLVLTDDDGDDDDEVLELKERLAAYNLESSPDHSAGKYNYTC